MLRVTVFRLKETPKYLVGAGRDDQAASTLLYYADKSGKTIDISVEQLKACGEVDPQIIQERSKFTLISLIDHVRGLFATRKLAWSTSLVFLSWFLMGLSYAL